MKIRLLSSAGMFLIAAALIFTSNDATAAQTGGIRDAGFQGVSFRYDASLAGGAVGKMVPETIASGDTFWWTAQPRHIEFNFTDFHGASAQWFPPTIYVFPVRSSYTSLTPTEKQDLWLPRIQPLQEMLAKQSDPRTLVGQITQSHDSPPEMYSLPPVNAGMILTGKLGYWRFRNGLGIRYLVQGTQDISPPDHDNTGYTFQGLTDDGK